MVRRLPPGYLADEGEIAAAIREGDATTLLRGLRELGYLPGEGSDWDGELLLDYMRELSWWLKSDGVLRLAPEDLWRSSERIREQRRDLFGQLRRMTLPPEALLLRRMEGLLFQIATTMRAAAPWGLLLRELIEDGDPVGELGAEHAAWLAR